MIATTKRGLKATPNYRDQTFTLRISYPDGTKTKYRTTKLPKGEFENCLHNTEQDWFQFLKSDDYYKL